MQTSSKPKTSMQPHSLEGERRSTFEAIKPSILPVYISNKLSEENEGQIDWEAEHIELDFKIRIEKKALRKKWNKILTRLVVAGFVLSYLMIVLIGLNIMKFENSPFAVPAVLAAGIAQTYGLAKLAIQYFFSEDDATNGSRKKFKHN